MEIISYSPATDTIGDSVFYVEADGGSYISDYLNTYSYGRSSPRVAYANGCFRVDRDGSGVISTIDTTDSYGSKIYTNLD